MKNRFLLVGTLLGFLFGFLIGGRDVYSCIAAWILSVPFGAAIGYFTDTVFGGLARPDIKGARDGRLLPKATAANLSVDPAGLDPMGEYDVLTDHGILADDVSGVGRPWRKLDTVTEFFSNPDTRRNPADIKTF